MTKPIEPMPKDVLEEIKAQTGMGDEQVERMGVLSQRIRDFAIDNVCDGDMISPANLAVAGLAAKMAGNWLQQMAIEHAGGLPEDSSQTTDAQ